MLTDREAGSGLPSTINPLSSTPSCVVYSSFFGLCFGFYNYLFILVEGSKPWAYMEVRGQPIEISPLLQPCGSRDQTQGIRLGSKNFYPRSHLTGYVD